MNRVDCLVSAFVLRCIIVHTVLWRYGSVTTTACLLGRFFVILCLLCCIHDIVVSVSTLLYLAAAQPSYRCGLCRTVYGSVVEAAVIGSNEMAR